MRGYAKTSSACAVPPTWYPNLGGVCRLLSLETSRIIVNPVAWEDAVTMQPKQLVQHERAHYHASTPNHITLHASS